MNYIFIAVGVAAGMAAFSYGVPKLFDKIFNAVRNKGPYEASQKATELHSRLRVADLHSDALLMRRDLLVRGTRGHVDVPRLLEGNVTLQSFTVVTKTPFGMNINKTKDKNDMLTLFAVLGAQPTATWGSLLERALLQARALHGFERNSGGRLVIVKSSADLKNFLERRETEKNIVAGFLGLEGAHALEGDLANIDLLYKEGYRMIGPTHFFDNDMAGSMQGVEKGGLTPKGRDMIRRLEEKKMIIDLAHSSARTIDDVLEMATRPVLVSHTGVKAVCDNNRNLTDDQLKAIADKGGLIGVGFWKQATCGTTAVFVGRALDHAISVVGVDHVALGSDFDGFVPQPFDSTGLVLLTEQLMDAGYNEEEIAKVMGENTINFLLNNFPEA